MRGNRKRNNREMREKVIVKIDKEKRSERQEREKII